MSWGLGFLIDRAIWLVVLLLVVWCINHDAFFNVRLWWEARKRRRARAR